MPVDQPASGGEIIRPDPSISRFLVGAWFLLAGGFAWSLWRVRLRPHETVEDMVEFAAFFGTVLLFLTVVIINQITLKIELVDRRIAVSTFLKRRRELSLDGIESARYLTRGNGRLGLRLIPADPAQKPVSFQLDVLTPADADRIKAWAGDLLPRNQKSVAT